MKRVSPYLKMRVLGAIEGAQGETVIARIHAVSAQTFTDDGVTFQFTWRTIQTWYSRYKKDGITSMKPRPRSDKGTPRKVEPELLLEAIEQVRGSFRGTPNMTAIYRACIERNLLTRDQVAPNTFRRLVHQHELLKPDAEVENKPRLAFAKAHANELWQADTMYGPHVRNGDAKIPSKLIAFIDDASRVCCHAEFFLAETTDTLIQALKTALYKRGVPDAMYVDNGSIYSSKEIHQICTRLGCLLCHAPTVRYAGVLGSASKLRARLAPKRATPAVAPCVEDVADVPRRSAYRPWAELLKRTFGFDVLACPRCEGRMRLVAMVTERKSVARYLRGLGEPTDAPAQAPARGPPYWKSRALRRAALGDEAAE